jgi:hypothetical protein
VLTGYRATYLHEAAAAAGPQPAVVEPGGQALSRDAANSADELPADWTLQIVECSYYRGRLRVGGRLASPAEVDRILIAPPGTAQWVEVALGRGSDRELYFEGEAALPQDEVAQATLIIRTVDDRLFRVRHLTARALAVNPVWGLFETFKQRVLSLPIPRVLEIGARMPAGTEYHDWLAEGCKHVRIDVEDGFDADLVVDAHAMSEALPARYFDAAFSLATFGELAMPWVVAVELNRVLRAGAYVYIAAHQTWPVVAPAGDYFRFSERSWASLFNAHSGFEICEVAVGEPARIVAHVAHAATMGLEAVPAFLTSAVLARKVGETDLQWDAPVGDLVTSDRGTRNG